MVRPGHKRGGIQKVQYPDAHGGSRNQPRKDSFDSLDSKNGTMFLKMSYSHFTAWLDVKDLVHQGQTETHRCLGPGTYSGLPDPLTIYEHNAVGAPGRDGNVSR